MRLTVDADLQREVHALLEVVVPIVYERQWDDEETRSQLPVSLESKLQERDCLSSVNITSSFQLCWTNR